VLTGFRKDEGLAGLLDVYGFGAAYFVRSLAKLDWLGCLMWLRGRVVPLLALVLLLAAGALEDISRAAICRVTVPIEAMSSGVMHVSPSSTASRLFVEICSRFLLEELTFFRVM